MSQSVEAELAALEAEVQEPMGAAEEDVEAALEALLGEVEDEPAAADEAEKTLPAEAPLAMTQPADEPEEAPPATQPAATQPVPQPAAAPEPAPEPAAEPTPKAAVPKAAAAPLLKRKPMLSVAKKSAKGRTVPEEPRLEEPAAASAAAEPAEAAEPATEEPVAEEAAPAAKPAIKPAAKKLGLAKPAAKPAAAGAAAPPAPAPKAKAPATKPKAAKPAAGEGAAEPAVKAPKRPCTAYFHFMQAQRSKVKAANPELDNKALVKRLAEMWKDLDANDKQEYEALAAADKERYQAEVAAAGPLEKKPRAKSAYQLYCDSRMADIKAANPKAGMPERSKLLAAEWAGLSDEAKLPYVDQTKELKKQLKAAPAAAAEGGEEEAAAPKAQKKRKAASTSGGGGKRGKGAAGKKVAAEAPADEEEDEGMAYTSVAEGDEEEVDAEAERMDVDWDAHGAVCILSETRNGKFVVMREGVNISQYGLVDAAAVRQQRLSAGDGSCPVSLEMLADYEDFVRTFKTEVHFHSEGGTLELEDLPDQSTLDTCLFLGLMREPGYPLNKKTKHDVDIKVPLLGTCQLVQRMVLAERRRMAAEMAALRKENAHLRAAASGAAAVAEQ